MKSCFQEIEIGQIVLRCSWGWQSVNKRPCFFRANFLSVWAAASLPPPSPYSTFFSICTLCAGAKTCLPCLYYIWIMFWIKVALDMAATLWTPNFQVSLEKVHKIGKQGIFLENTWKDLERRLPRGGIAFFLEFSTLKSCLTYLPLKQRGANCPPPP